MNGSFDPDHPEFAGDHWNITWEYLSDELFQEGHEIIDPLKEEIRLLHPWKMSGIFHRKQF
jgi:hypothetical protein